MEFQQDELNEILTIFQQESSEIISSMDGKLLALENDNKNKELAMQLFRDAHSLKGSARMLGFEDIQNVAHKIEDVISLVREDKLVITGEIADTISNCLSFISDLINKTVENKEEYKSPELNNYISKLEKIAANPLTFSINENEVDSNSDKGKILSILAQIEGFTVSVLFEVSYARKNKDFSKIYEISAKVGKFLDLTSDIENIDFIKQSAQNIANTLEEFKNSENKEFSFLEVNNAVTSFIEALSNYLDSEHIKRQSYYDIVDKKLETAVVKDATPVEDDKTEEILQKVPLMEINSEFSKEASELISSVLEKETNHLYKKIYSSIKDLTDLFASKKLPMTHDIALGIKDALEAIKHKNTDLINETIDKIEVIKTMAKFQYTESKKPKEAQNDSNQKDILSTITNTEIKTLRVDSIKLDNLVGQIGELIVSKIKTNEQLSLAKKIDDEVAECQKNFVKMSHYIQHFDKKFLPEADSKIGEKNFDYRKFAAYNKQLGSLIEAYNEKFSSLAQDMENLFKQLQESETKLNATTNEIENMVKNMRILPLSTIFQLFPRMVHNIARDKGKKIDLVIEGADITADKTIIEEIKIPLMHIIRNSIDHGIEDPKTRVNANKSPQGRIEIAANYIDNKLIIDVKDDGRGLDIEKIKAKALEKKILTKEELNSLSDDELTNLIFYPGFSTEDVVTELSGRGLGLDIVSNKINQMQGRIDIFSRLNKGTVVRIILPAAVATRKVFVIEEQKELYAIETSVIKTILRINPDEIFEKDNKNYYIYENSAIGIYTLSSILGFENPQKQVNKYTLLIIETESSVFGIIVEKLISDQEIVHKKLAPPLYKVKNISGITTLANGEACLILNVSDIISTIGTSRIGTKIATQSAISSTQNNFKYNILIVDDSQTTRILQKNILSKYGYSISTATNPINALEKVKHKTFDLIISDVQMPQMNGFEFIKELRKMPEYENKPIIVMSSEKEEEYLKEISETRIITYIQKNTFKQEKLIEAVQGILNY